jgi:YVTN family beta-propeller protein
VLVDADHLVVASSGRDEVLLVRLPEKPADGPTVPLMVEARRHVGAHPRGVSVSPDGKQVWVANELDSTLSVLDSRTLEPVRTVALGIPRKRDLRLDGRYVFGSAALTQGGRFTCNSCHPDGGADGLTWRFTHVPDGIERRNTKNLRGSITLTAPFRWSGREKDIEVFFQEEIVGLFHGPRQEHETLHALWNIMDQLFIPPNPNRLPDGKLTAAAARGKRLFEGKAGCGSCHAGEYHGGTGKRAWVGTTRPGQTLDVPHLMGVYDSAPYLHDGSAPTLESVFAQHDPQHKHGNAHALTAAERADLLRYVREL